MPVSFSEVMSRLPLRMFQVLTFVICMIVLVADGLDQQLLGIVAPLVIAEFGVERGIFGFAMTASLVGFGLGSWSGGWLGDRVGRRWSLALAAAVFSLGTVAASTAGDVWQMAFWRLIGGLGFGAAYSNAITLAGEWLPERWRSVGVTTISVGTPAGGMVAAALVPTILGLYDWRGAFVVFGIATFILCLVLVIAFLRDSPSFLLARGKKAEAQQALGKITDQTFDLVPERHASDTATGSVGVFDRSNLRMNIGVSITFTSVALVAYGILNWTTTILTASGFTLEQASYALSIAGLTSIAASIAVGLLIQRFGSRVMVLLISITLLFALLALAWKVEALPALPTDSERMIVVALVGIAAAIFSAGMASNYAIMTHGYPSSCRSAGIGFGIFMARIGAIISSGFGGWLLDLGNGSTVPFFTVMCVGAVLVFVGALVVDKHVPPAKLKAAAGS
jgi:AAHS family 4-hydroxybenzoate transporter-like MFS transporter